MHSAAWRGDVEQVKSRLGNRDVHVDRYDSNGLTALELAAFNMHAEVADLLASANSAIVNHVSGTGITALHIAVLNDDVEIIMTLLREGADPLIPDPLSPFHLAIALGGGDIVDLLYAAQAERIATNGEFWPLHWTVFYGQSGVLWRLLKLEADPSLPDKLGRIPLHFAAMNGDEDIIKALTLNAKSNMALDHYGRTPLHYLGGGLSKDERKKYVFQWPALNFVCRVEKAASEDCLCKAATALMDSGVDIARADNDGVTALSYSAYRGYGEVASEARS
jgi:ankyrin repeat protein